MKNLQKGPVILSTAAILVLSVIGGGIYIYTNKKVEENKVLTNKQQVEKLLIQEFNQPLYDDELTIKNENDNYIVGQANVGEGGILVMAAKVNATWTLVYTGNAFVDCDNLREYDFPAEFLPSYCDCDDEFYTEPYSERIRPKYCN